MIAGRNSECFFESRASQFIRARRLLALCLIYFCLSFLNSGCASKAVAINDLMVPYGSLKAIIKTSMPHGVIFESVNGREMTSGYFSPTNFYDAADNKAERVQAKVVILGSSRPFRVEVKCVRERRSRDSGKYIVQGEDVKLSKQLAQYFKDALADRREDRNLFDDFRPF